MIFGDCPYCGNDHGGVGMPESTPCVGMFPCESCGNEIWMYFSRIMPEAYTKDDFDKEFTLNHATRTVERKAK